MTTELEHREAIGRSYAREIESRNLSAVEAGAQAWFDRIQAQRMDAGRKRPDGQLWQWDDLTETDRVAYRALARPVVLAALKAVA